MPSAFHRTLRSLRADASSGGLLLLAVALALLGAWGAWFTLARVTVYAVSASARLEVDQEAYPIEAPVSGRVVESHLALDRTVEKDEVLVQLDSEPQRLELEQARARLAAIGPELKAQRAELSLLDRAQEDAAKADETRLKEQQARSAESEAAARLAEEELERDKKLLADGTLSTAEWRRTEANAEVRRAAASALALSLDRTSWEQRTGESNRRANLERLSREVVALEGELQVAQARVAALEHELARRRIVAPVAGRIGEVRSLKAGEFVGEGDRLAAVIPKGRLRAVAQYTPASAIGRVRPGAPALLRVSGFPWTQYGCLHATVRSVGQEIRDGTVRVELELEDDPTSRIPVQHGLAATAEVAVERVSPATLTVRLAGHWLDGEGP